MLWEIKDVGGIYTTLEDLCKLIVDKGSKNFP